SGTLTTGSGTNSINFTDDLFDLTGDIIGGNLVGGGTDTLSFANQSENVSVNLQTSAASGIVGTFSNIETFTGGGGTDSLRGVDAVNTFNVTSNNAGNITGGSTTSFSSFETLSGGTANDTFVFSDGVTISGTLNGRGDTGGTSDVLDYSAWTTGVTVDLDTGTANNIFGGAAGGLSNVESLIGGSGNDVFTVASSFAPQLTGNGGDDTYNITFVVGVGQRTTINENAAGGTDTVNLTGTAIDDAFVLTSATLIENTVSGREIDFGANVETVNLDGSGGSTATGDTLTGFNTANTFNITGSNAGDLGVIDFSNIQNLTGNSNVDQFVFTDAGSLSGAIDGAGGTADVLTGDSDGNTFTITAANTGGLTGKTSGWSNIENLNGGTGTDTFTFSAGATVAGTIDGVSGT
ncbi:MAG: hypothetical protein AAF649_13355, partial [Verrucomicrobiota bacterium]